jgi:hypothetical protein
MASVKANVYVPPIEETTIEFDIPESINKINIHVIIYLLMGITLLLFVKKLVVAACHRLRGTTTGVKHE